MTEFNDEQRCNCVYHRDWIKILLKWHCGGGMALQYHFTPEMVYKPKLLTT